VNKYLTVARIAFMDRLAFRSETFLGALFQGARILMAMILWGAVLDGRGEVGGYDLPMMLTHYLFASFLPALDQSEGYVWEFAAEIREGAFGKYLARPIDPLGHFMAVCIGRGLSQALSLAGAAVLWSLPLASRMATVSISGLAAGIPLALLGLLCMCLLNYLTALLAFKVQDILPWHMAKSDVAFILMGAVIPMAVLPDWLRRIVYFTPFPFIADMPAALAMGRVRGEALRAYLVALAWAVALYGLCRGLGRAAARSYTEVGA
jgi:ABC-2 type transport system permease protein